MNTRNKKTTGRTGTDNKSGSSGKGRAYRELFSNYLLNVMYLHTGMGKFRPMITNFYVTTKCDLRCRYCYPPGSGLDTDTETMLGYLEKIRYRNPVLNITGGEPLLRDDVGIILKKARDLNFYPILLSTNGLKIERIFDSLDHIDHLIISLDSLDSKTNDMISGVPGVTGKITANIRRCATLAGKHNFNLSIHSVITPENLDDIPDIVEFCGKLNISLSLSPENSRYYPNPELVKNDRYFDLIGRLIEYKKDGFPVFSSHAYLRKIRTFEPHNCYPFVSPRVEADGKVYFPCQRIKESHVHLDDYRNLYELMIKNTNSGNMPNCRNRCYLTCYMEVDRYLHNPFSLLSENLLKRWVFGAGRKPYKSKNHRIGMEI